MFELYTQERGTFPFIDYAELMGYARNAKSALEFGPGISTLALVEAKVPEIVTLEHASQWRQDARRRLKQFPSVQVLEYKNVAPVALCASLNGHPQFDLAFVDSPSGSVAKGTERLAGQEDCSRLNTCLAALRHSKLVYLHDWYRPRERATLGRLAALGHKITVEQKSTFARIERKC